MMCLLADHIIPNCDESLIVVADILCPIRQYETRTGRRIRDSGINGSCSGLLTSKPFRPAWQPGKYIHVAVPPPRRPQATFRPILARDALRSPIDAQTPSI